MSPGAQQQHRDVSGARTSDAGAQSRGVAGFAGLWPRGAHRAGARGGKGASDLRRTGGGMLKAAGNSLAAVFSNSMAAAGAEARAGGERGAGARAERVSVARARRQKIARHTGAAVPPLLESETANAGAASARAPVAREPANVARAREPALPLESCARDCGSWVLLRFDSF